MSTGRHRPWWTADLISLLSDLIKMAAIPAAVAAVAVFAYPYLIPLVSD